MPRNRADVARDTKLDEIVTAARRRLADGGYEALSVADIARELGLAPNAIYWYFPTKDELLVAAVERTLHDVLDRKPKDGTCVEQVLWFADRLAEFQDLRVTIRERARASETVASFERNAVALLRVMLVGALQHDVPAGRRDDTADAVMALCEGVLLQGVTKRARSRILRFGIERLIAG